jgi:hypothetical protein
LGDLGWKIIMIIIIETKIILGVYKKKTFTDIPLERPPSPSRVITPSLEETFNLYKKKNKKKS